MAKSQLEQRRILITGASSGIGRELARQLATEGARVLVTARRQDRLAEITAEIEQSGGQAIYLPGDLASEAFRQNLCDFAQEKYGGLDVLINNAGIGAIGDFADADSDRLRNVMEVNFFAPVELIRVSLPMLRCGNQPLIVNVSSVLAHRAVPTKSEYCASKFAIHGFSDALRAELANDGIQVLLASPSTTASEFFDDLAQSNGKQRRGMPPATVAKHIVRAMQTHRHEIIISYEGKLLVWLDRLWPTLANKLMAKFG